MRAPARPRGKRLATAATWGLATWGLATWGLATWGLTPPDGV